MVPEAESLLNVPPLGRSHTRASSTASTADMIEISPSPGCCCQCHCQDAQPSTSATATLRSNTSATLSAYSCNTSSTHQRNCSQSCDHHLDFMCGQADSHTNFLPATSNNNHHNNYTTSPSYISEDEDSVLRYSFKGIPPEMYSAKKEFIYRRPLVEKQVSFIKRFYP